MEIECLRTRATEIVEWELSFKWRLVPAPDEPREKSQGSLSKAFLKGERKKESSNPLSPKRLIVKVNTQVSNLHEREKYFKTKQSTSTPFWIIRSAKEMKRMSAQYTRTKCMWFWKSHLQLKRISRQKGKVLFKCISPVSQTPCMRTIFETTNIGIVPCTRVKSAGCDAQAYTREPLYKIICCWVLFPFFLDCV